MMEKKIKITDYQGIEYVFDYNDVHALQNKYGICYIGVYNKVSCPKALGFIIDKELYEKIKSFKEKQNE